MCAIHYKAPCRWTLLFLLQRRNVLPFHQNSTPNKHQSVIRAALVMMGEMKLYPLAVHSYMNYRKTHPASKLQGVINLPNP
jgi:hypothetical protein